MLSAAAFGMRDESPTETRATVIRTTVSIIDASHSDMRR